MKQRAKDAVFIVGAGLALVLTLALNAYQDRRARRRK
jgi:hypothetical protein